MDRRLYKLPSEQENALPHRALLANPPDWRYFETFPVTMSPMKEFNLLPWCIPRRTKVPVVVPDIADTPGTGFCTACSRDLTIASILPLKSPNEMRSHSRKNDGTDIQTEEQTDISCY